MSKLDNISCEIFCPRGGGTQTMFKSDNIQAEIFLLAGGWREGDPDLCPSRTMSKLDDVVVLPL